MAAQADNKLYVTAALICERILREADGVPSAIRIVDQVTIPELPPELPAETPVGLGLSLLIALRGESIEGVHKMQLRGRTPSGTVSEFGVYDVAFSPKSIAAVPGANVFIQTNVVWRQAGVYWFDVLLDGDYLTSIPLEVRVVQPQLMSPLS